MSLKEIRKELNISNGWIAEKLGYLNVRSYNKSKRKKNIEKLITEIYTKTKNMKTLITLLLFTGFAFGQLEVSKSSAPILVGEYKNFAGLMAKIETIDDTAHFIYRDVRYATLANYESFSFHKEDLPEIYDLFFGEDLKVGESKTVSLKSGDVLTFTKAKKYVSVGHYDSGITRALPYMKDKHIDKLFGMD